MKRVLEYSFLLLISCFSFYLTYVIKSFIRQNDSIMNYLNEISNIYTIKPIEAIIENNTIIPGLNGKKINIDKSYNNIKKIGFYNDNFLVFNSIKNNSSLASNLDKYIIKGNKYKRMVSLLLYLDDYNNLDYLNSMNIHFNYIENNHDIKNQKHNYCFNENLDDIYLKECYKKGYYSIYANVITNNYLYNVKKSLESGSFIVLKGNYENEIEAIIAYIQSKGYRIDNLDNHLREDI